MMKLAIEYDYSSIVTEEARGKNLFVLHLESHCHLLLSDLLIFV